MVDTLYAADAEGADTGLHIGEDNIFCLDGLFREPGLIEHIAQSAAAFAGYPAYVKGEAPKLGYIGEIKKLKIAFLPKAGSLLHTRLDVLGEAAGVTLVKASTDADGEPVASCQMKIFLKED